MTDGCDVVLSRSPPHPRHRVTIIITVLFFCLNTVSVTTEELIEYTANTSVFLLSRVVMVVDFTSSKIAQNDFLDLLTSTLHGPAPLGLGWSHLAVGDSPTTGCEHVFVRVGTDKTWY